MRLLALLLLPALALAQGRPQLSPQLLLRAEDVRTTAAISLYVDPTGNDGNACTASGTAACLTIAGALKKIPSEVCHTVTVTIAAGNYTGFVLDRFRPCNAADGSTSGSITINGTLIPATLATGSASFSFTSQTVGTSLGNTWGVLNNTGASWTTNNLRGLAIEAAALSVARVIASNTSTAITLAGPSSASANTSTAWVVEDWGTVITTGATFPGFPGSTNYAGIILGDIRKGASSPQFITVNRIKVSTAVPKCIYALGNANIALRLIRCDSGSSSNDQFSSVYPIYGSLTDSVMKPNNARYAVSFDTADSFTFQRNVFIGTPGYGIKIYSGRTLNSWNNYFVSQPLAGLAVGSMGYLGVSGDHYDTSAGQGCIAFGTSNQGFLAAFGYAIIDASDFQNCSGSAIYASGPVTLNVSNSTGSTGNVRYGVEVNNQTRAKVASSTVTGALGDTAVGPTPTVTAYGSIGSGVSSTTDFSRIHP